VLRKSRRFGVHYIDLRPIHNLIILLRLQRKVQGHV
jgi:hypothetical protein